jgi:hypothetical protein
VKSYWAQLGDKLGPYAEPFAIVMLDLMSKCASGTQLSRVNWHRGAVTKVRLVGEERDIEPHDMVDSAST